MQNKLNNVLFAKHAQHEKLCSIVWHRTMHGTKRQTQE
jgi:hypothetical protein